MKKERNRIFIIILILLIIVLYSLNYTKLYFEDEITENVCKSYVCKKDKRYKSSEITLNIIDKITVNNSLIVGVVYGHFENGKEEMSGGYIIFDKQNSKYKSVHTRVKMTEEKSHLFFDMITIQDQENYQDYRIIINCNKSIVGLRLKNEIGTFKTYDLSNIPNMIIFGIEEGTEYSFVSK